MDIKQPGRVKENIKTGEKLEQKGQETAELTEAKLHDQIAEFQSAMDKTQAESFEQASNWTKGAENSSQLETDEIDEIKKQANLDSELGGIQNAMSEASQTANAEISKLDSEDNSDELIEQPKEADSSNPEKEKQLSEFEQRRDKLRKSNGKMPTFEAYSYIGEQKLEGDELKTYLDNPENWIPERRALHDKIVASELAKAQALSERLEDSEPTIYAMRGNTAAGKTTRVRNDEIFAKAIDANGQPSGAINPDICKEQLKTEEVVFGQQQVNHYQAHAEGSMLSRRIQAELLKSKSSMIIDQRLYESKDINEIAENAEKSGKKIKMMDVEAPLELSLIRVLNRTPGKEDPLPPFSAVADGFKGVQKNRRRLIDMVESNDAVENYVLYVTDRRGNSTKLASKVNGVIKVEDGREQEFDELIDAKADPEIARLKDTVIDDAYLEMAKNELGLNDKQIASLAVYKGKTFEKALDEHSRKLDVEPPTDDEYLANAMTNLKNTSRTAKGTIDTSASVDKADKMITSESPEATAETANNNYSEAIRLALQNKDRQFQSPEEVQNFIIDLVSTINKGITKEGVLLRTGADSEKYPYAKVSELNERFNGFCQELFERLNDPKEDPASLAAWAEYKIDLSDHYFADGCGKTAKAVSGWIMMRGKKPLPDYSQGGKIAPENIRTAYYDHAPKTRPGTNAEKEQEEMQNWTKYYKQLT